jgi:hypothetical protein
MTRKTIAALAAATALAITLGGCARTAPILNLENVPVTSTDGKPLTAAQVRSSIVTAGTSLGWRIVDAGPGKLEGTLMLREHTAVVDIPYSARSYSIVYKRSDKLNEMNGTIHSNYNGWVQNLDRAIRTEMSRH